MKASVIIPTYNEEKDIQECLSSLEKQSLKNFEVIVVDDGSSDRTYSMVQSVNKKLNIPMRVYRQNHEGPAVARNRGAKHARGEILVFVDADMTFKKDFLEKLILPIEKGQSLGTFSKEEYVSNWDNNWAKCWNYMEGWENKKRHPKNYPSEQKVFRAVKKSAFDKVGGFSKGGYTDDYSLHQKLGTFATAAKGAVFYHRNPDSPKEIFSHAKWVSKRNYKFGYLGILYALLRSSFPASAIKGLYRALKHKCLYCFPFQIVYDAGIFVGLINYWLTKQGAK